MRGFANGVQTRAGFGILSRQRRRTRGVCPGRRRNKEYLESPEGGDELVRVISTETRCSARFQLVAKGRPKKTVELKEGDSLGLVHTAFDGLELAEVGANSVTLSNGIMRRVGDPLAVGPHLRSYQDGMLQLALDRHFETERENFRRGSRSRWRS